MASTTDSDYDCEWSDSNWLDEIAQWYNLENDSAALTNGIKLLLSY